MKHLKGECQHCGVHIEFPAESIGTVVACPACGQPTELMLAAPPTEPAVPQRVVVYTIVAIALLVLGLVATIVGLKRFEHRMVARQNRDAAAAAGTNAPASQPGAAPEAQNGFRVGPLELERTPANSLVYAVGTASNTLSKQRFGVRVEIDLLNAAGEKIGTARDYQQVIEPGGQWRFKALVVEQKAATAKLNSISEQP